ncbi:hypothetical protein ACO0QE_001283 [Hanseniaspora vineae]
MTDIVKRRSLVFYTNAQKPELITTDLDLNSCYKPDEIVVKVHYAAFNPIDYILYKMASSWFASKKAVKTFGRDFIGEVVKVGKNVPADEFSVGDKVAGLFQHLFGESGTMSDYLIFDPKAHKSIAKIDSEKVPISPENGAWPLVFGTSYQALTSFELKKDVDWTKKDKRVLIVGASTATGIMAVQIAKKELGAAAVDGICSAASFERNKEFGFDTLFDYKSENVTQDVIDHVSKVGVKYDVIYDCCGNSYFFNCMDQVLKPKNENSYYVSIAGDSKINYASPAFPSIVGAVKKWFIRCYRYHQLLLQPNADVAKMGIKMITEKNLTVPVDTVYQPEDYEKAFDKLTSAKAKGKVVVSFV